VKKQAKEREMHSKTKTAAVALASILGAGSSLLAQQKGQYGNGGTTQLGIPRRLVPFYSSHAIGVQSNLIVPAKGLYFYFKYEPEYLARSTTQGRTFVFGGSWNLRFPKEQAPKP
jgi:hypothetical protein